MLPACPLISFKHEALPWHDENTNNLYLLLFIFLHFFSPRRFRAVLTFRTAVKAVYFPSAVISPARMKEMKENKTR